MQYLVSFPLHMLRPWAFVAMLGQVSTIQCSACMQSSTHISNKCTPLHHDESSSIQSVQVPLGILTSITLFRGQIGNVIVWASIVLGQPIAILMYLHDYYVINWAPHNITTIGETLPGT